MYIPDHFAIKSTDEAYRIIEAHPLGILVTSTDEGLDANHLPFELDAERGVLSAHIARANPCVEKVWGRNRCLGDLSGRGELYLAKLVSQQT